LPLALLAVFLLSGINGSPKASAGGDSVNFFIAGPNCSTVGAAVDTNCNVGTATAFTVTFNIDALPSNGSYDAYGMEIDYSANVNYVAGTLQQGTPNWGNPSECGVPTGAGGFTPGVALTGCTIGLGSPSSTYLGQLLQLNFQCKADGVATLTLTPGAGKTETLDTGFGSHSEAVAEVLTVDCKPAPTATPIPPTPTPGEAPRMLKSPALQNIFLTRQGDKIPPSSCQGGSNVANLNESLDQTIGFPDPKDPSVLQQLGAFQFEVRFDDKLVCVDVEAGLVSPNLICDTLVAKGLVRFGCFSIGKGNDLNDQVPTSPLAIIHVRPQEELYSQLRPNQDNGIPVQILNQGCNLADEQGHVIPVLSCEDADITFRYLEGDVSGLAPVGGPDCVVDLADAANMAFRWGAATGNLLYSSFLDLSPSGQIKGDGRIDVKDLQFVYGRLGSTCTAPWPAQAPVNPKA
jgi:hypothetical protein